MPGRLILCATPIGNLGDLSARLGETLGAADIVYAEDTRRAQTLLDSFGIRTAVRSYFAGNEPARSAELAERLAAGDTVALVTDAGTPAVADPGVSAVQSARRVGAQVSVVPGPSAVTAALACSGFGADRFVFEGFLPRKGLAGRLDEMSRDSRTIVCFSTPHRFLKDLGGLRTSLGGTRQICVARELTKRFEEVWWGSLDEAVAEWTDREIRGEFTLVIEGSRADVSSLSEAIVLARRLVDEGLSRSKAARLSAEIAGASRSEIYEALV